MRIVEVEMTPDHYQGAHIPGAAFWNIMADLLLPDLCQNLDVNHIEQRGKRCSLEVESWTTPPSNQTVLIGCNLNFEQLRQELEQRQEFEPTKLSIR